MKKTFITMLALVAGAMVFTACSSDEFENNNETPSVLKPMTFYASMEEQGGATRATIDGTFIKWENGDKISIFDGSSENNGNQEFTLATGGGTISATFTGSAAAASTYYALYPYVAVTSRTFTREEALAAFGGDEYEFEHEIEEDWQYFYELSPEYAVEMVKDKMEMNDISAENQAIIIAYLKNEPIVSGAQLEGNCIKGAVIPAEQIATPGSADPNAMLMIAKSTDASTLKFKNVCAYVKVTPQFNCSVITITSNGEENLAGTVTVDYNEGNPTTTVTDNGSNSVYLKGTIIAGNTYYIAVRPETLKNGFFVDFLTDDKTHYYQRSTSKSFTFVRSNVIKLGEFETGGTWTYNGVTSGNDGGHNWVLVAPNVRLATTALGVNIKGNEVDSHLSDWGAKWVVPLSTDLDGKLICTYDKNNKKATISGKGALRELPIVMQVNSSNTWCKDSPSQSGFRYVISLTTGGKARANDNSNLYKHDIIYKYVG